MTARLPLIERPGFRAALIMSDSGMAVELIADLVGHSTPNTAGPVYRHQLRPVIKHGARAMDDIFGNGQPG